MSKLPILFILAVAIAASFSISESYAFDPQMISVTISDSQTQSFVDYDIITIVFSLFNGGTEDAVLSGHSMLYLNDTNSDYWEYVNHQDLDDFTETDCPSLDTTVSANSTSNVKLCFLTFNDVDVGYSVILENNDYLSGNQPNEFVLESVPDWFTTTANAWCTDTISDSEYINSAQSNIQGGIIDVLRGQSGTDVGAPIPAWVKTNACDWSNNQISDYEYLDGIYWLIDNGKIQLD